MGDSSSQRSKPRSKPEKVYLSILETIKKDGKLPALGISKQALNKYVCRLKKQGLIKRISYATWEATDAKKEVNFSTTGYPLPLPPPLPPQSQKNDAIRLHNVVFLLKSDLNWLPIINRLSINYSTINKGVYAVTCQGVKTWLCRGRIVIYVPPGIEFKASSVNSALELAVAWLYSYVQALERLLGYSLRSGNSLVWSFSRKHISLVRNALAEDLEAKGIKLRVYDDKGLWLLTDYSFQAGELEGIRNADNISSMRRIKAFFNNLKDNPNVPLPSETYELILGLTAGLAASKSSIDALADGYKEVMKILEGLK